MHTATRILFTNNAGNSKALKEMQKIQRGSVKILKNKAVTSLCAQNWLVKNV
jgi:hypothetical protein